jgi:hypothetical protein
MDNLEVINMTDTDLMIGEFTLIPHVKQEKCFYVMKGEFTVGAFLWYEKFGMYLFQNPQAALTEECLKFLVKCSDELNHPYKIAV